MPSTFYQASVEENHRSKIKHTVKRIRKTGRSLSMLQYFTSRTIRLIDKEEEELSLLLEVAIKIRDRKWISSNINHSPQTVAAFQTFLLPRVNFLRVGARIDSGFHCMGSMV